MTPCIYCFYYNQYTLKTFYKYTNLSGFAKYIDYKIIFVW